MAGMGTQVAAAQSYIGLDALMRLRGEANGFSLLPRQPRGGTLAGRHSSRLRGRGLDFAELRRYQAGDDVRFMDWLATARTRAAQIRLYAEEQGRVVLLLIDQRITMFFGSRRATKSVIAAQVAALATWRVLKAGDHIAGILFDDHEQIVIRPSRQVATAQHLLSEVARLNNRLNVFTAPPRPSMLNLALDAAARLASHDWLIVTISDAFGVDDTTTRLVTGLGAHNDIIALFVHDPLEAALPALGSVVVAEGPARLQVETGSKSLRHAYASDFADRRDRIQTFGRHRTIPVVGVQTTLDVATQIRIALSRARPA